MLLRSSGGSHPILAISHPFAALDGRSPTLVLVAAPAPCPSYLARSRRTNSAPLRARTQRSRTLAEHVVDAVVIGAGPGGYHAAIRLGQLGKKVICVDRDEVGGVCLNWGCIPTKALLHVGEVIRHIDHAGAIGLKVEKAGVDREGVAKFKTDVVNANVGGVKTLFKANNVQFLYGEASFKSANEIAVKTKEGGEDTIRAHDGEYVINSDDAVQLKRVPKTLLVIGGGVIGLEFATVYTRMGAKVLVIEALPQILTGTDLEISKTLGRILKKQGVEIMLSTKVNGIKREGKTVKATFN